MKRRLKFLSAAVFAATVVLGPAIPAVAADNTVGVGDAQLRDGNPASTDDTNWYRESTGSGGAVDIYGPSDPGAPSSGGPTGFGDHALELTTNSQASSQAQLLTVGHIFNQPLANVNSVSYYTYQDEDSELGSPGVALPSLQLQIDFNGLSTSGGFTTLVFEPYQEQDGGPHQPITPEQWQFWDATTKRWWTTHDIDCTGGTPDPFHVDGTSGGGVFTTLSDVAAGCPDAVLFQFGVNIGSGSPNVITATDGLHLGLGTDSYSWDFGPK
jgi:hypothetical protein